MSSAPEHAVPKRAQRFALAVPVRYRRRGSGPWSEGLSIDASRTGLLFATEEGLLPDGERIDFRIRLAAEQSGAGCDIRCTGRVTRSVPRDAGGEAGVMAVSILRYTFGGESGGRSVLQDSTECQPGQDEER